MKAREAISDTLQEIDYPDEVGIDYCHCGRFSTELAKEDLLHVKIVGCDAEPILAALHDHCASLCEDDLLRDLGELHATGEIRERIREALCSLDIAQHLHTECCLCRGDEEDAYPEPWKVADQVHPVLVNAVARHWSEHWLTIAKAHGGRRWKITDRATGYDVWHYPESALPVFLRWLADVPKPVSESRNLDELELI